MEAAAVMGRASGENFPVASRVLPRRVRAHLLALYGFARLTDELGDSAEGDRLAALEELERDLDRAYRGEARHPLLVRLQPTLRACSLPREPFVRLIEANRVDQRVRSYDTWEQLRGYCELSANPVGELVLHVFGLATPARIRRSDAICTALQLAEHCQDVAEDRDRGRVYLPAEDLARFGASASDLSAPHAGEPLRRTIAFEIARARELLREGASLLDEMPGLRERLAIAAFLAGGRAALDAIERAGCDVLAGAPRAGAGRRLLALARTLREPRTSACDGAAPMSTQEAYRRCEAITRASAANFYYGIRLLARERRRAMCAVYAFAREIDDIGDGQLPPEEKLRRLNERERALAALAQAPVDQLAHDPVMVALADAGARFAIPPDALRALIAGVRMDVEGTRYETFEELVLYCRRVAGAIGRACLAIFALRDPAHTDRDRAYGLADDLGVALQLTNILRDIREDAQNGRVYLPAEDLRRFEVAHLPERREGEHLDALMRFEAARARGWFARGIALVPLLDRRSGACVLAMAGIYSRLLGRIAADPERALRERVALPMREKAWVAARGMLGGSI
jgi:15-cis-phytoene synthase